MNQCGAAVFACRQNVPGCNICKRGYGKSDGSTGSATQFVSG
jgi:hypothetical protein